MSTHSQYKLKVRGVSVYTNLEVKLKARPTKEEAKKEVEKIMESKNVFEGYDWKIEGCSAGGINELDASLQTAIIERLGEDEPEESVFWDGMRAVYDMNVYHVPVNTNLEVPLKSSVQEEAVQEVKAMLNGKNLFEGYAWQIEGCPDGGINEFSDQLRDDILQSLSQVKSLADCIEPCSKS